MENLSDALYMDHAIGSSSSSNVAPSNNAGAILALPVCERSKIERLISLVNLSRTRSEAITQLNNILIQNEAAGPELGRMLWESSGIMYSLLEELMSAYRSLSPPRLTMTDTHKICNALAMLQCIAFIPEKRVEVLNAHIPTYFYPYMITDTQVAQYDYLRTSGLGVIEALVKETGPDTPIVVRYLLQFETVPVCLCCMEMGDELTKSVATLVLEQIFNTQEGKTYIGTLVDRFYAVEKALDKMVDEFTGKPEPVFLKNILICYLRLSQLSSLCPCCDALKRSYHVQLRNPTYLNFICDDSTRDLADQVLHNINSGPQVQYVELENAFAGMRI